MLSCANLCKCFDGVVALNRVDLSLDPSHVCALIGPNGAGKTTLLNALTGFVRPDSGQCFFRSRDITRAQPYRIAGLGLARTFQDLRLVRRLSVLENVMMAFPNQRGESVGRALLGFGLASESSLLRCEALDLLRQVGLQEFASREAGELSYGQQKLLNLVSSLATRAEALLFDEPFAGVDLVTGTKVLSLIRQLRADKKTILFVEHDIEAVRQVADRVVVMSHGVVIADGEPRDVLERQDILETYLT